MGKIKWKILIACLVITYLAAVVGSLFTTKNVKSDWYDSIKPSITPPNWVFPVVWNILFFLIALSLYFVWTSKKSVKENKKIIIVYGINFLLNVLWSVLFFSLKQPRFAFIELLLLWISTLAMLVVGYRVNKKAFYLLIPYLVWLSFAGILNYLAAF